MEESDIYRHAVCKYTMFKFYRQHQLKKIQQEQKINRFEILFERIVLYQKFEINYSQ